MASISSARRVDRRAPAAAAPPRGKVRVDFATILGLAGSFALLGMAVGMDGSPDAFVNLPGILIVIGGSFAVTMICFSLSEVLRAQAVLVKTVYYRLQDPAQAAIFMIQIAQAARRNGVLGLQGALPKLAAQPFLYKCLAMVTDERPAPEIQSVLHQELHAIADRHLKSANVFRKAAEIAPAMGLIGTLIGLVQMLGRLEDPSTIGPAMAVALLTTFYGAILGNVVFGPLAAKLERNSSAESLVNRLYLMGAVSIARRENPRQLEFVLNTVLPRANQVRYFD